MRHWKWSIWVDEPPEVIAGIEKVVYTLHPTFTDPVHTQTNRKDRFRLRASGWGEFLIDIQVHFTSGDVVHAEHWLKLGGGAPTRAAAEPAGSAAPSFLERLTNQALVSAAEGRASARRVLDNFGPGRAISRGSPVDVFISYAISQSPIARALPEHLGSMSVRLVSAQKDLPQGVPVERWTRRAIADADGMIALLGARGSESVMAEAEQAIEYQKPVLVVADHSADAETFPGSIRALKLVRMDLGRASAADLAGAVMQFIEEQVRGRASA